MLPKKILPILFICLACACMLPLAAQDYGKHGLSVDAYGTNMYAAGDLAGFLLCTAGGGAALEWKVPKIPFLGLSLRLEGAGGVPQGDAVRSWWSTAFQVGVWADFAVHPMVSIRPEFSYGVGLHGVHALSAGGSAVSGLFADQLLQIAAAVRISPPIMAKYGLSLEAAPVYTLLPEQRYAVQYLGFRIGLYYKL